MAVTKTMLKSLLRSKYDLLNLFTFQLLFQNYSINFITHSSLSQIMGWSNWPPFANTFCINFPSSMMHISWGVKIWKDFFLPWKCPFLRIENWTPTPAYLTQWRNGNLMERKLKEYFKGNSQYSCSIWHGQWWAN